MKILKDSTTNQSRRCSCCYVGIRIIFATCMLPMCYSQTITNKPAEGDFQCPGQVLVFTCMTRGSLIITWESAEYIGANRLQFSDSRSMGDEESASGTVANLTRNFNESGEQVLESQLRITVGSDVSFPSITCKRDNGTSDSVTLRVLQVPTGNVTIISDQRKNSVGGCVVHFSWAPPSDTAISDISHFEIAINGTPINGTPINDERNISKGFAMRSHPVCSCGTYDISIATVNRCGGVGPNVTEVVDYPESDAVCEEESDSNVRTRVGNKRESRLLFALITVSVIACLLLIAAVTLLVMLILVCCEIIPHNKLPCVAVYRLNNVQNGSYIHKMKPTNI